jgi:hypothetical protein
VLIVEGRYRRIVDMLSGPLLDPSQLVILMAAVVVSVEVVVLAVVAPVDVVVPVEVVAAVVYRTLMVMGSATLMVLLAAVSVSKNHHH